MPGAVVVFSVALAIVVIVLMEVIAATLPMLLVILLVPPEDRAALAQLIAATDSSRRLRLWPALRVAVRARRHTCAKQPSPADRTAARAGVGTDTGRGLDGQR
jgi:hypothetical protein